MEGSGQGSNGGYFLCLEHPRPVQRQIDILPVDVQHDLVPGKTGGWIGFIQLQHGIHPRLKGGQDIAGTLAYPQQKQGLQRPVPRRDKAQIRVMRAITIFWNSSIIHYVLSLLYIMYIILYTFFTFSLFRVRKKVRTL